MTLMLVKHCVDYWLSYSFCRVFKRDLKCVFLLLITVTGFFILSKFRPPKEVLMTHLSVTIPEVGMNVHVLKAWNNPTLSRRRRWCSTVIVIRVFIRTFLSDAEHQSLPQTPPSTPVLNICLRSYKCLIWFPSWSMMTVSHCLQAVWCRAVTHNGFIGASSWIKAVVCESLLDREPKHLVKRG